MSALCKRILPTLAVLAVACAQVFGMQRGYSCNHGEAVVETKAEHCHRVSADDHTDGVPCDETSSKDCDGKGKKEHHAPLNVDLQAPPAGLAPVSLPVFVAVLMADIPAIDWVSIQALAECERMKTPLDTGGDSPPSAAVQVARCMVILV